MIQFPKAFIFDMDGTLIESSLDFIHMRDAIGCPHDQDILAFVDGLTGEALAQANAIIAQQELDDAYNAQWVDGARQFIDFLNERNVPMGIVTRNSRQATKIKLTQNEVAIERVLTREDAPAKPDPTALLMIAQEWQIAPQDIAYVGDYRYDILAANNANMHAWSYGYREAGLTVHKTFDCYHALLGELATITVSFGN